MRFNCAHTFVLEAEDQAEFDAKLARYRSVLHRASERLGIGYSDGLVWGQRSADRPHVAPDPDDPDDPPERLFDERD